MFCGTTLPSIRIVNCAGTACPPLLFETTFIKVIEGAMSLLVTVHVLLSPGLSVIWPPALQSPLIVA